MDVKHYVGDDMRDIMDQIRTEMGSDAIILHTGKTRKKGLKGWFSKPLIEVVAAHDRTANDKQNDADSRRLQAMELQLSGLHSAIERLADIKQNQSTAEINPTYSKYIDILSAHDVNPDIASEIMDKAMAIYKGGDMQRCIEDVIKEYLGQPIPISLDNGRQSVIIFLGPTGVGKTTTLAKLAAYYGIQLGKKAALITADTYRIAAVEQLRTYSDIMQLPLSVVYSSNELKQEIGRYSDADIIMIDTPGRSPNDIDGINDIKDLIKASEPTDVFLLVSASFNYAACQRLWQRFGDIKDIRLLFTKLDETDCWGAILNMRHISRRPLSYITDGQVVPDDIKVVDVDAVAAKIVRD